MTTESDTQTVRDALPYRSDHLAIAGNAALNRLVDALAVAEKRYDNLRLAKIDCEKAREAAADRLAVYEKALREIDLHVIYRCDSKCVRELRSIARDALSEGGKPA